MTTFLFFWVLVF